MSARRRLAELQVAFMTLTRLPAGRLGDDPPRIADASWAFPLCGMVVGALAGLAFMLADVLGLPPLTAALVAIGVGLLATGALHEDGLADLADGFGGGRDKARKLEIMRDSRIGSYGVLALVVAVALKASCMAATAPEIWAFVALAAASRATLPVALAWMPPARDDGLGVAAAGVGGRRTMVGLGLGAAALVPLGGAGVAVVATMAVVAVALAWLANRQIGGQTGDVLGAIQASTEAAGWMCLAALAG